MFRIGAHVSISGGFTNAPDREAEIGGNCGQIFSGSPRGWKVSRPGPEDVKGFREKSGDMDIGPWIVHSTYLINFATPKKELGEKSLKALQAELDATAELGILYYVFHPGAHTGAGVEKGIHNVADRISKLEIPDNVKLLLENTAGKGTTLGKTFAELRRMIELSGYDYSKLGVCLDTCHMYAAGYDFRAEDKLEAIINELDEEVGLDNLHYIHLNDSKHPLGSQKDEHEHLGEGEIGEGGFRLLINYRALRNKPMVLETPVDEKGFSWNIQKVRDLRE